MNTEKEGKSGTLRITREARKSFAECRADFMLPEYKADIKRVLHTSAHALPASEYTTDGEKEITGVVAFEIMYLSDSDELVSVGFTGDWTHVAEGEGDITVGEISTQALAVKVTGPRKIGASCKVMLEEYESVTLETAPVGTTFSEESSPEVSKRSVFARTLNKTATRERELAEELAFLPGVSVSDVEVVFTGAQLSVSGACVSDSEVSVSGEVVVLGAVSGVEGGVRSVSARMHFDEKLQSDIHFSENSEIIPVCRVSSASVKPFATEDGVKLSADAIIELEAIVQSNEATELIEDAFSKTYNVENEYKRACVPELIGVERLSVRKGKEVQKTETDAHGASEIVYLATRVDGVRCKREDEGVKIEGEIVFSGVACEVSEDGRSIYAPFEIKVPFAENVNYNLQLPEDASVECHVSICDARVDLDARSFYADCTLNIAVAALANRCIDYLSRSECTGACEENKDDSVVTVYYPEEGETLFDVAKRFKASPSQIASDNALSSGALASLSDSKSLVGIKRILIK